MSVFLTSDAELRSGWRCAVYVAIFVMLLFATGALLSLIVPDPVSGEGQIIRLSLNAATYLFPASLTLLFMVRFVDRLPLTVFGVALHEKWMRDFGLGLLIAAGMIAAYCLSGAVVGNLEVRSAMSAGEFWGPMILILVILAISAASEELIFRGYLLQILMVGLGPWPAIIAISAFFGLGHHLNPNATWLGTVNTALAGVLLSLAYLRTRSLWFPYGIHLGWNLSLGPLMGFPLSGVQLRSVWQSEVVGVDWVTGGAFGPEGGILGTGVIIAAVILTGATRLVGVSPTLRTLLTRHSGRVYSSPVRDGSESPKS